MRAGLHLRSTRLRRLCSALYSERFTLCLPWVTDWWNSNALYRRRRLRSIVCYKRNVGLWYPTGTNQYCSQRTHAFWLSDLISKSNISMDILIKFTFKCFGMKIVFWFMQIMVRSSLANEAHNLKMGGIPQSFSTNIHKNMQFKPTAFDCSLQNVTFLH